MNDTRPGNRKLRTIGTLSCALGAEAISFRRLNSGAFRARSLNRVFRQEKPRHRAVRQADRLGNAAAVSA